MLVVQYNSIKCLHIYVCCKVSQRKVVKVSNLHLEIHPNTEGLSLEPLKKVFPK